MIIYLSVYLLVQVTLVLNGKTIASSQKTVKSVPKVPDEEAGLGIKEYL